MQTDQVRSLTLTLLTDQIRQLTLTLLHLIETRAGGLVQTDQVRSTIGIYRNRLLDLGVRNPLIDFRTRRATTDNQPGRLASKRLEIPLSDNQLSLDGLYRQLLEGKSLVFEPRQDLPSYEEEDLPTGKLRRVPLRSGDLTIRLELSPADLERRMREIYRTSREFVEEQGINALYLGLGKLAWEEAGSERSSPLLLVPVEVVQDLRTGALRMVYSDGDLLPNQALALKLKPLGVQFPLPASVDPADLDPLQYLASVQKAVEGRSWKVEQQAFVGFFSYAKLALSRDLEAALEGGKLPLEKHPILGPLLGGGGEGGITPLEGSLDRAIKPDQIWHVLDADSSQAEAIYWAQQGRSLVIEGPPGTGKSQTITNIIATLVGQGKTVLFVAEKEAALTVVHDRLVGVGLGDACLSIHSRDANRTAVMSQIRQARNQDRTGTSTGASETVALGPTVAEIEAYGAALHAKWENTGYTPYQMYGELLHLSNNLAGLTRPRFDLPLPTRGDELDQRAGQAGHLSQWLAQHGNPRLNPFYPAALSTLPPGDEELLGRKLHHLLGGLGRLIDQGKAFPIPELVAGTQPVAQIRQMLERLNTILEAPLVPGMTIESLAEWKQRDKEMVETAGVGRRLNRLVAELRPVLTPEAWQVDPQPLLEVLHKGAASWFQTLLPAFRRARKQAVELFQGNPRWELPKIIERLSSLAEVQRCREQIGQVSVWAADLLGFVWQGEASDWDQLVGVAQFLGGWARDEGKRLAWETSLLTQIWRNPAELQSMHAQYQASYQLVSELLQQCGELEDFLKWPADQQRIAEKPPAVLRQQLEQWQAGLSSLKVMVDWNQQVGRLEALQLKGLLNHLDWSAAPTHLAQAYRAHVLQSWLERVVEKRQPLAGFRAEHLNHLIEQFRYLDQKLIAHNRKRVLAEYRKRLPPVTQLGQGGILERELARKRSSISVRELLGRAGRVVQAYKPVFLMSPLSISTFLPLGGVEFDAVIFDEASQVKPEDAVGALMRGRQVIVVGDSNQLGPTAFFQKIQAADEEEAEDIDDSESLLKLFETNFARARQRLTWHYRSRHPALIATSNEAYYHSKLVTFPAAQSRPGQLGLKLHYLPTAYYEAGKRRRVNREEADAVVARVLEHSRERAQESLIVVTMNRDQANLVMDLLERVRMQGRLSTAQEEFLFPEPGTPDRFVVKNIENVQGDERDVVIISMVAGNDASGSFHARFGSLERKDGWRRLNVLITRARLRCEIFCNFRSSHIKVKDDHPQSNGFWGLRAFIRRAEEAGNESQAASSQAQPQDDPLLADLGRLLQNPHWEVHYRVGTPQLMLELALYHPASRRYLLGLDLDGPAYQASRWLRDRERLRLEVLKGLGWRIMRVWSSEYYRNPAAVVAQITEMATAALNEPGDWQPTASRQKPVATPITQSAELVPMTAVEDSLVLPKYIPYDRVSYVPKDPVKMSISDIARDLGEVVEKEGPIPKELAFRRLVNYYGITRIGNRIRDQLEEAVRRSSYHFEVQGDFLYKPNQRVVARDRSNLPPAERKFGNIAPLEIQEAVLCIIRVTPDANLEELVRVVSRILGFKNVPEEAASQIHGCVKQLVNSGKLRLEGSMVLAR